MGYYRPRYLRPIYCVITDTLERNIILSLVILVVAVVVACLLMRGPIKKMRMGSHLTKMTNILEEVEATRTALPIGLGGGIDSLPLARQVEADRTFREAIAFLKGFPRHEVTEAVAKNALLAEQMGRHGRYIAIGRLLDVLVEADVALGANEFAQSYS